MRNRKPQRGTPKLDSVLADAQRDREKRAAMYRDQALKLFPHVCGRCGREFDGRRLRELTVHHKDHNHDNNPPDGSNWELLCDWCHEMEHAKHVSDEDREVTPGANLERDPGSAYKPFANLEDLLKGKK